MTVLVAITGWDHRPWLARFRALAPGRRFVHHTDTFDPAEIRHVAAWKPPRGLIAGLPRVAAIFNLGAGVDALLTDPSLPDVPIVRVVNPDLTARMCEYVVLHVLYHHRGMNALRAAQALRQWPDPQQPAAAQVRVGLMGMGELGRAAAAHLVALGFQVAGWSRRGHDMAGVAAFAGADGLDAFLARTDILVTLMPLTPDTRHMIDLALLRKLPRDGALGGAVLINPGRGGLQVEADILAALDAGSLIGASLDVFEREPLDAASPLWAHPAVVITPHNAADSDPDVLAADVLAQIARHEAGEPLDNVVDRAAGY